MVLPKLLVPYTKNIKKIHPYLFGFPKPKQSKIFITSKETLNQHDGKQEAKTIPFILNM